MQPSIRCSDSMLSVYLYNVEPPFKFPLFFFYWHCILQKTVNTVRHRKQVDNNESDCGKSACSQDQPFCCLVALLDFRTSSAHLSRRPCLLVIAFVCAYIHRPLQAATLCMWETHCRFVPFFTSAKRYTRLQSEPMASFNIFLFLHLFPTTASCSAACGLFFRNSTRQKHLSFFFRLVL